MDSAEIIRTINSFPSWTYQFNLKGNLTPVPEQRHINRYVQRKNYFFDPLVRLLGGSLKGKRVLDLGCNAGFWSLLAVENGCDFVMGIDGRQMCIDQANFVFKVNEIEENRYKFVVGNLFDLNFQQLGTFDVVLCLGLLYHVSKPMEILQKVAQVNSDILVIDTRVSRAPGAYMEIQYESLDIPVNAVDYALVMLPTKRAVFGMAQQFGYSVVMLRPRFRDYKGARDYRLGFRRAFLCAKKTKLSHLPVEIENIALHGWFFDIAFWGAQRLARLVRRLHLPLKASSL